ncbi:transposase [Xenorhabdus sp. TS4]|nr:transposase [Xenorhabdus sp. TS4]
MNTIKVVGIDLAKNVFQVCVWMADGSVASHRKLSRQKLLDTVRSFPPGTVIAMEACATSHYWGSAWKTESMVTPIFAILKLKICWLA